jgi:hypothetical protein
MKYILASGLFVALFLSCSSSDNKGTFDWLKDPPQIPKISANQFDFSRYKGKTIESINYCDSCGMSGDLLIIHFTDGDAVTIYAYKYDMKVYN